MNGGIFRFELASLQIEFLAADLARISWGPGKPPVPYAIEKSDWGRVDFSLEPIDKGWTLSTNALEIQVLKEGSLIFFDPKGNLLRKELPPERRGEADRNAWSCQVRLAPEECIYGLGEQAGPFNLRGTAHRIWNTDPKGGYGPETDPIYMPLPVYVSLHKGGSYLVFYENSFPAVFDFGSQPPGQTDTSRILFDGGMLRYYFIPGFPSSSLLRFTQMTGRPEMPPKWSLGYHHSRWGYQSKADIYQVVKGFRQHNLQLSAVHLDIDYMKGYRLFTVDEARFPNLHDLAQSLLEDEIRLVAIVDVGVKVDPGFSLYKDGKQEGRFCMDSRGKLVKGVVWPGWSVYPDFTDSKTREWWKKNYQTLITSEIAGFWHDMNEPTSFALWGELELPYDTRHKMDGEGGDHLQAHNLYALLMNQAGHAAMKELRPDRRPWIISRSGWVSQQRYAWNWTGDTKTSWESLRMTIPTVLGQGLSGLPYTGPDIGGFSGNPDSELYLRWFQLATFLPFFRTHSSFLTARREPWVFGDPYTGIIRDYIKLRYQLMPYLYSLAWQTSQTGLPLVRPLFWLDPTDQKLWDVEDAFMLGESILVAPALRPGEFHRVVQLPPGRWFSWWDESVFQGPDSLDLDFSLEQIPLLVRGGSIIPLQEGEDLLLHIFPQRSSDPIYSQILYSDSGDGYGTNRLDRLQIISFESSVEISWTGEGEYPLGYNKINLVIHGSKAKRAFVDEQDAQINRKRIETQIFRKAIIEF